MIDNSPSDDSTRRLVAGDFPDLRYVHEPRPGLDIARNRALLEARGDIIASIDDDAVADCHWYESLVGAFSGFPRAAVCTGRVEALTLETKGQRMFEANGGFSRGKTRIRLSSRDRQRRGADRSEYRWSRRRCGGHRWGREQIQMTPRRSHWVTRCLIRSFCWAAEVLRTRKGRL